MWLSSIFTFSLNSIFNIKLVWKMSNTNNPIHSSKMINPTVYDELNRVQQPKQISSCSIGLAINTSFENRIQFVVRNAIDESSSHLLIEYSRRFLRYYSGFLRIEISRNYQRCSSSTFNSSLYSFIESDGSMDRWSISITRRWSDLLSFDPHAIE